MRSRTNLQQRKADERAAYRIFGASPCQLCAALQYDSFVTLCEKQNTCSFIGDINNRGYIHIIYIYIYIISDIPNKAGPLISIVRNKSCLGGEAHQRSLWRETGFWILDFLF